MSIFIYFFNDTATTEIYTLSLHDALPISDLPAALPDARPRGGRRGRRDGQGGDVRPAAGRVERRAEQGRRQGRGRRRDRKSTRLNSSHANISYAVFCLKKKNSTCRRPRQQ